MATKNHENKLRNVFDRIIFLIGIFIKYLTPMQAVGWIHKQVGKIADKFENYKFYIHSTPDNVDSSSRLFLNAYSSRDQQAMVPCTYRWFRIKNGISSEVVEFKGNTFICEPSDVGSILQAEVTVTFSLFRALMSSTLGLPSWGTGQSRSMCS